ncbi:MAG: thiopurine S-methyltransferase [Deltaproteobacteria bacterium]|nr:thiopurine S-methyltransferase [Deltaproteobacteria bacterium]
MNVAFWRARWQERRIGFHEGRPNTYLERHVGRLEGARRVLVPLCGKADDLAFLAARGHEVVGVELVETALQEFCEEHGLTPTRTEHDGFVDYAAGSIRLYAGDMFATTRELLGPFDAIYDRAALVALPPELRVRYVAHLRALAAPGTRVLAITFEYPQAQAAGPPFSVEESELRTLYAGATLALVDEGPDPRVREGMPPAVERCFLITL